LENRREELGPAWGGGGTSGKGKDVGKGEYCGNIMYSCT
jgi:hypothetical protein